MRNPLVCEKCEQELPSDDAIAVIDGICTQCRQSAKSLVQPIRVDEIIAQREALARRARSQTPAIAKPPSQPSEPLASEPSSDFSVDAPPVRASMDERPRQSADRTVPAVRPRETLPEQDVAPRPPREEREIYPPQLPSRPDVSSLRPSLKKRRRRRDLVVGVTIGLLVSVGLMSYFLSEKQSHTVQVLTETSDDDVLILTVSPLSAVVKLGGMSVGPPDAWGKIVLSVSSEETEDQILEISADGYRTVKQPLSQYSGAPEAFIELTRNPYELSIATTPPQAEVWIDDEEKGRSPIKLVVDPSKNTVLLVRKEGYHPLSQELHPPQPGERCELNLDLSQVGPVVSVETEPPGARITINGMARGTSPLEIELPPDNLGRDTEIIASASGYDDACLSVTMPDSGNHDPVRAKMILARRMARIKVDTEPPGGRVVIGGQDYGEAPATVAFESSDAGKTVVIEASRDGAFHGREVLTIPPLGETIQFKLSMAFNAQRVMFVLAIPPGVGAAHYTMTDQLTLQIQALQSSQRFAILAATNDGMVMWPDDGDMELASSEQKIRAYDFVRALRPTRRIDADQLLLASLEYDPTAISVFIEDELDRATLDKFDDLAEGRIVSVSAMRISADSEEEARLSRWTARHYGTLTVLGGYPPSVVALDEDAEH